MDIETPNISTDGLDGLAFVLVGAYAGAVVYQGNFWPLFAQLKKEKGYLEFVLACAILAFIVNNDKTGIAAPMIGLGILGVSLNMAGKINLSGPINSFANGRTGLFATIKSIANIGN